MVGCAIVAIPQNEDPVWKISSEKVPHMTMLFLGEALKEESRASVVEYISHVVATSLRPFGLMVDHRGLLGDEDADVLFFDTNTRNMDVANQARNYFLRNADISTAYHSIEQYPQWTPHLTLGYPSAPAKKVDDNSHGWVFFDRISIWFDEFAGPEFRLQHPQIQTESGDLTMSVSTEEFLSQLSHHGVKGQKWGVRKDRGHEGERTRTKKITKLDKKFEKSFVGVAGWVKVQNQMASHINGRIGALNDKYAGQDVSDGKPAQKKYLKDYEKIVDDAAKAATEAFGTNASGTGRVKVTRHGEGYESTWKAEWEDIKHADGAPILVITPKFNDKGFVISQEIELIDGNIEQSDFLQNFLAHFGVKGMRWGVRRDRSAVEVSTSSTPGRRVTATGGENQPAHEDAVRSAASRRKARASTTDALSTKELKDLVERMNLEQQYSRLSAGSRNTPAVQKFLTDTLANVAKQQVQRIAQDQASQLVGEAMKRRSKS